MVEPIPDNPFFVPPLQSNGQHPVTYTDDAYERMEAETARVVEALHTPISTRLDRIEKDLGKVLDVVAQLEAFIAKVAPVLDELSANPAKFLMSVIGGGKSGR